MFPPKATKRAQEPLVSRSLETKKRAAKLDSIPEQQCIYSAKGTVLKVKRRDSSNSSQKSASSTSSNPY